LISRIGTILFFVVALLSTNMYGGERTDCRSVAYVDKNQVTPDALGVKKLKGRIVTERNETPLEGLCAVLFNDADKKFVAFVTPNRNGQFRFKNVPKGRYRLIVKHEFNAYCVANILIEIGRNESQQKSVLVVMKPEAIDDCSYGRLHS
jgi:hypothetical protein